MSKLRQLICSLRLERSITMIRPLSTYPAPGPITYLMIYVLTTRPFVPEASILFPYHRALAQVWMPFTPTPLSPSHCLPSLHSAYSQMVGESHLLGTPSVYTRPPLRLGSGFSSGLTNLPHSTMCYNYLSFLPAMTVP